MTSRSIACIREDGDSFNFKCVTELLDIAGVHLPMLHGQSEIVGGKNEDSRSRGALNWIKVSSDF